MAIKLSKSKKKRQETVHYLYTQGEFQNIFLKRSCVANRRASMTILLHIFQRDLSIELTIRKIRDHECDPTQPDAAYVRVFFLWKSKPHV